MKHNRLSHFPEPNYEAIIYDRQDTDAVDPSSSVGHFATLDTAIAEATTYTSNHATVTRWEVRDRAGMLVAEGGR